MLDNKARSLQIKGNLNISHNVLSKDDLATLFKLSSLSKATPEGFQAPLCIHHGDTYGNVSKGIGIITSFANIKIEGQQQICL